MVGFTIWYCCLFWSMRKRHTCFSRFHFQALNVIGRVQQLTNPSHSSTWNNINGENILSSDENIGAWLRIYLFLFCGHFERDAAPFIILVLTLCCLDSPRVQEISMLFKFLLAKQIWKSNPIDRVASGDESDFPGA